MGNKLTGLVRLMKKPLFITGAVLVLTIIIIVSVTTGGGDDKYEFIIAEKRGLVQEVSVTGQVKAAKSVDLSFEQTGTISQVLADVADGVGIGQTLVTLRNNDIVALLNQAEAQIDVENAILNNLKSNTQQGLQNSYNNALNTINDALTKSEDAVRSKTVGLFSGSEAKGGYNLSFSACTNNISYKTKTLRLTAELELNSWNKELNAIGINPSNEELDTALILAQQHLDIVEQFVDVTNQALLTSCAIKNSTLDAGRTSMATAQTNVLTVRKNINNLMQTIALDKISADKTNDIAAQEAKIRAAEASANNYRAKLAQTIIKSPINGVVTKQEAKVGESVSVNMIIVSVISTSGFKIEAFIPEADISKVKVDDISTITLDAYGSDVFFGATVAEIEPGETVIEGVTTYKTTFRFTKEDERVKSGMTANIDVFTAERTNVIAIPQRAVISKNEQKFVRILSNQDEIEEVVVKTGLRGSDGSIEITEGLNVGDKIVTFIKEEN